MQPFAIVFAFGMILAGAVLMISPIPFGAFLLVGGLSLLLAVSERARRLFRLYRERHPKLDVMLADAEEKAPELVASPLESTDGRAARLAHALHGQREAEPGRDKD